MICFVWPHFSKSAGDLEHKDTMKNPTRKWCRKVVTIIAGAVENVFGMQINEGGFSSKSWHWACLELCFGAFRNIYHSPSAQSLEGKWLSIAMTSLMVELGCRFPVDHSLLWPASVLGLLSDLSLSLAPPECSWTMVFTRIWWRSSSGP